MQNRHRVVSKDDLVEVVWGGRIVSELTLTSRINAVRKAIGDSGDAQRLIRTLPRKGIRFVGVVREERTPAAPVDARSMAGEDLQSLSAVPRIELKSVPRLSIVVLPFANLSNDPDQEYFADAITEDLTTDLSRISGSFVIARNTAFTYKGKAVDAKQIGRELGVRYVMEGSVRRSGSQVRVNAQLVDAETGAHVWAERFETDRRNLSATQSEITARLAQTLNLELIKDVGRRIDGEKSANPDAQDLVMRGWSWYHRPRSAAATSEAQRAFERALAIEPRLVDAQVGLARVLTVRLVGNFETRSLGTTENDSHRAEQLLLEAIESDPNHSTARSTMGYVRQRGPVHPELSPGMASSAAGRGGDLAPSAAPCSAGRVPDQDREDRPGQAEPEHDGQGADRDRQDLHVAGRPEGEQRVRLAVALIRRDVVDPVPLHDQRFFVRSCRFQVRCRAHGISSLPLGPGMVQAWHYRHYLGSAGPAIWH